MQVGHDTAYAYIGNQKIYAKPCHSQTKPKFLRASAKPVHKCFLYTGFTKVLINFGRSDNDMV